MLYFFYQPAPKTPWVPALASQRAAILKEKNPALCTVLDVDSVFDPGTTADEAAAAKYSGPLYWDIDSEDLATAIQQAQKLLTLIQSKGVNLNSLRCYLSGGKGFHILMDQATFMPKAQPNGVAMLPAIYKEMVWSTAFVDDVDMRVYSAGRGRMLRCVNYKRENGLYKVSATPAEIFDLDEEKYRQLCSSPRNDVPIEAPTFNHEFGLAYSLAFDKVGKAVTKRKSRSKTETDLKGKFKGEWPETLKLIINGLGIRPEAGFNQIAMQVAITAVALGKVTNTDDKEERKKQEEQFLTDCAGLINDHKGDSDRYGTPRKRRAFLREMIRYVESNPLYEFSAGGILSLLEPEFRGNADITFGEYVPDTPLTVASVVAAKATEDGTTPPVAAAPGAPETIEIFEEDQGSVRVSKAGIFVRSDEGFRSICEIGVTNPVSLRMLNDDHIGFEVDVWCDGKSKGRRHLPMSAFASRGAFHSWAASQGGAMLGTDIHAGTLVNIMRKKANRSNSVVYAIDREGVDVITPPGCTDKDQFDIVWASSTEVISTGPTKYHFASNFGVNGYSNTDLMLAPDLTTDDQKFIDTLLSINSEENMAKLLGWFSASFLTQLIRKEMGQFPLLQVFGQAGAGKSATVELLNGLHYYMHKPRQMATQGNTFFPILVAVGTSASIPVVFEEMKPRQMEKRTKDAVQGIFRSNYRADRNARGSVSKDKGTKELTVTDFNNSAPLVFVGEAIEDQAAIIERCVIVSMSQSDRFNKGDYFEYCQQHKHDMGKLGKRMVQAAMSSNIVALGDRVRHYQKELRSSLSQTDRDKNIRPLFNLAVVMTGLEFLAEVLRPVFGTTYDARIESMQAVVLGNVSRSLPNNMSEASRVLDVMAQLSRNPDPQYALMQGIDYTLSADGKTLDLKLRTAYAKYVKWQRSLGQEVLFDTESSFIAGLSNYSGTLRRACPENDALYDSTKAIVYRLNLEVLEKEGVDSFGPLGDGGKSKGA